MGKWYDKDEISADKFVNLCFDFDEMVDGWNVGDAVTVDSFKDIRAAAMWIELETAPPELKISIRIPSADHDDEYRWNFVGEYWEVAEFDTDDFGETKFITHKDGGVLIVAKVIRTPVFHPWKRDTRKVRARRKLDDGAFTQEWLGLFDSELDEPKVFASVSYLAKKNNTTMANVRRQRTKINNIVKKHYPEKILLKPIPHYTAREEELLREQRNELVQSAEEPEDLLQALGLDDEQMIALGFKAEQ